MRRLKPRERELLWMAYAEGASHKEIAEVLGLRGGQHPPAALSGAAEAA